MSEQDTVDTATVDDEAQVDEVETDAPVEGEDALEDKGKKALDTMKAERNAAKAEARRLKTELDQRIAADALKDKPAEEQALEAARAEARAEATTKANERILRADLRAAATGKLADPTDAALYINLSEFTVSDDGDTDSDALNDAISDLITRKPHLAAQKPNRFDGDADQGAKGKSAKPAQLSREDLSRMTPREIVAAQDAGQLTKLMGIK